MPNSPFEIEQRYLSHLTETTTSNAFNTRVSKECGTVELIAATTAFQSSDSSLCSVNYTFPVEIIRNGLSIAPIQLATLTKQLTNILFSQLVNASQAACSFNDFLFHIRIPSLSVAYSYAVSV